MRARLFAFSRRPLIKNLATMLSGTAVSQLIAVAFTPLITRLYGPEAFGVQSVFMSIAGIFAALAALTFPLAVILPASDREAYGITRLALCIAVATSSLTAAVLYFYGAVISRSLNAQSISEFLHIIPFHMLISVAVALASQWLIRVGAFKITAQVSIAHTLLLNVAKAGMGIVNPTAASLIITNVLGGVLMLGMALLGIRTPGLYRMAGSHLKDLRSSSWRLANNYRDFPLLRAPQILINMVSQTLPVVVLAIQFGPVAVGYYSLAYSVLAVPVGVIGGSISQVFYPHINSIISSGKNSRDAIIKATKALAMVAILPSLTLALTGPTLFRIAFGLQWQTAGEYARWLSLLFFLQFINKPAVAAIPALRLQGGLLIYELFSTGSKLLVLYAGFRLFHSDIAAVAMFAVVGAIAYVCLIFWVITHCGNTYTDAQ